ncbi:hypothetical protein VTI74DRAFT_8033 [Chaetomium olivicolor]
MSSHNSDAMDIDQPTTTITNPKPIPLSKARTLTTTTLRSPPFAYAHLCLANPSPPTPQQHQQQHVPLDTLQIRSYLTSALRQFLGDTGAAMPIDILLTDGASVWVRVPREDLPAFAAGITAFPGLSSSNVGGERMVLQVKACGDWLGTLIGRGEQAGLWSS